MVFTRAYVVVDMAGILGKAFFNSAEDALDWANKMRKQFPYNTFKVFGEITE